jgi:DMSO/TMAO reductase YedYZ molybdopterin-dependent catalytic subunit
VQAGAGAVLAAIGGARFVRAPDEVTQRAAAEQLPDGRPRLPPGQHVIRRLKPMGGEEGNPSPAAFRLRVYGAVRRPLELDFADLIALPQVCQECDVHCVTGWSVLGSRWTGVRVADLAEQAGVLPEARHVIFEAAWGYTANVLLEEALAPDSLVAHEYEETPLARANGAPVRALVPSLYFWKSAKWLTAIRFSPWDEPGFWEVRGYHNHADPWREERYG